MKELHVIVYGRVQGVFYRSSASEMARKLGLTGWVRNCLDGTVEAVAQGEEASLQQFLHWCHKGPDLAHVEKVEKMWSDVSEKFDSFAIL